MNHMKLSIVNDFFFFTSKPMIIKTIKLLEENIVECLHDFEIDKEFLNNTQKPLTIKKG